MLVNKAEPSEASSNHKDNNHIKEVNNHYEPKAGAIQGTKQERQQAKLAPEELVGMQVVSYALLNELLALLGKKERGALVAISEVLSAFKEGKANELEVVSCFFQQVKNGNVAGLESKKAILSEIASSIKAEHTEELWKYIRSWAGTKGSQLAMFNQFLAEKDSKETIIFHAKNWFIQQQSSALETMQQLQAAKLSAEIEVIAAKAGNKVATTQAEKIASIAAKANRTKLTDEEVTYLFTFADDEITNAAMEAQMELSSKAEIKEKLASKNIASEDL